VDAVAERVDEEKPDLVVISGDFTQRARTEQFEEACKFLERLRDAGHEVLGVPGNHDVPLYDVLRRFLSPLTRYRRYIDDTLCPMRELPGVTVLGINTARSLTFKDGRVSREQMQFIRETFERTDPNAMRILVTHHPLFALPVGDTGDVEDPAGRSEMALDAAADAGVDMLLAGHHHTSSVHSARDLVTRAGPALVVQAGTATSHRLRDEKQSFNRIDIAGDVVTLTLQTWTGKKFESGTEQQYELVEDHWRVAGHEKTVNEPAD
jgi:3',5'-cyclic AMP phosphodiesterase CpdA